MAATVKVKNLGPFDRDIRPDGALGESLVSVPVGGTVDLGPSLAKALAEQSDAWEIVKTPAGDEKAEG